MSKTFNRVCAVEKDMGNKEICTAILDKAIKAAPNEKNIFLVSSKSHIVASVCDHPCEIIS